MIIKCEDMEEPIVSKFQIADDGTFNIQQDLMTQNQWYSFVNGLGETVYLKLDNSLQIIYTKQNPLTKERGTKQE